MGTIMDMATALSHSTVMALLGPLGPLVLLPTTAIRSMATTGHHRLRRRLRFIIILIIILLMALHHRLLLTAHGAPP